MSISGNLDGSGVVAAADNPAQTQVQDENTEHRADIGGRQFRGNADEAREVPTKRKFFLMDTVRSVGNKITFGIFKKKEVNTIKLVKDLGIASDYTGGLTGPNMGTDEQKAMIVELGQQNLINRLAKAADQSPTLAKMLVQLRKEGWTFSIPTDDTGTRDTHEVDFDTKTIALDPSCATGNFDDVLLGMIEMATGVVVKNDKAYKGREHNVDLAVTMQVDFELRIIGLASELKETFPVCEVMADRYPDIQRASVMVDNHPGFAKQKVAHVKKYLVELHDNSSDKSNTTYAAMLETIGFAAAPDQTQLPERSSIVSDDVANFLTAQEIAMLNTEDRGDTV